MTQKETAGALAQGRPFFDEGLSDEETQAAQLALYRLLAAQTRRFTMGDSSSVPAQTAQELLKSVLFTIRLYLQAEKTSARALLTQDPEALLKAGQRVIESKIALGQALYKKATESAPEIALDCISLRDTLHEIGLFFKQYDYRLLAHDIPCSIDYRLCLPVPDALAGIQYVLEYLRRLLIENDFIARFPAEATVSLLESENPGFQALLLNLFEPVFASALGLALTGGEIRSLDRRQERRALLESSFLSLPAQQIEDTLERGARLLQGALGVTDAASSSYLAEAARQLGPRVKTALETGGLAGVFPSIQQNKPARKQAAFVDNKPMEDEKLRALIAEIADCSLVSDKIALVKRRVRSLRDLIEIAGICFWEEEIVALLDALDPAALALLKRYAQSRGPGQRSESGWEDLLAQRQEKA